MALIKYADYRPDVSDYQSESSRMILNAAPQGDGYGPHPSFSAYSQSLPDACRGAFYAMMTDGSTATFAGTATRLYRMDNTTFAWADVSGPTDGYSALSSDAHWQFVQTGNFVFATQANSVLQIFDVTTDTQFSDALGSPPQASYIAVVGPFIVLSGILGAPFRIQWSGMNEFNADDAWTSGIHFSDYQDFPDGGLTRGIAGGTQSGIIFQDQMIRSMAYMPGSPIVFQIDKISDKMGLFAPYSIIRSGSNIFFYAGQGFHKIAPGSEPQPIGREKVDRTFIDDLDIGEMQFFMGAADPRSTRVYWAYKSVSGASGGYDKLLGYDVLLDRFFPVMMSGQFIFGVCPGGITLEALDDIAPIVNGTPSLDAMTLSLDDYPTAVQPRLGQFDATATLGFITGTALEATIQTGEQGDDFNRLTIRGFRPITDAQQVFGSLFYRDTQQAAPIQSREVGLSRIGRCDMMRDARYSRFQVRIPAGTNWNFAAGVVPDMDGGAQQ